jgi:hypothetical protein
MEDAQGWETDPDLFTLKDEDYSSFERVLKGIRESIFTAITIPKEQLTSYGSSFYNMEANAQAFRKRLQSLVDEAKIVDFVIHGTWKTQSYKISRTGKVAITQVSPVVFASREIPFKTKYAGPHRPRRALHAFMKTQLNLVQIDATIKPVDPINWITFKIPLTHEGTL